MAAPGIFAAVLLISFFMYAYYDEKGSSIAVRSGKT